VSHFRMVMTGRMNRYMVLMKFRDGRVARKWRAEWDGKVFNTMEVGFSYFDSGEGDVLDFFSFTTATDVPSPRRAMSCSSSRSPSRQPLPIRMPASQNCLTILSRLHPQPPAL